MKKEQFKKIQKKLREMPKQIADNLTASHLARHIKVMRGVTNG